MGKAKLEVVGVGKRTKCVRRRRIMVVMWSGPAVSHFFVSFGVISIPTYDTEECLKETV
jgi:hypothetical protein